MDKYRRVERPKEVQEDVKEKREVHVTSQGKMRNYISYTLSLFEVRPLLINEVTKAVFAGRSLETRDAQGHGPGD